MPGPSEQSPRGELLDFFDKAPEKPFSLEEIADETGRSPGAVREELRGLREQGHLRAKEVDGSGQMWWRPPR